MDTVHLITPDDFDQMLLDFAECAKRSAQWPGDETSAEERENLRHYLNAYYRAALTSDEPAHDDETAGNAE